MSPSKVSNRLDLGILKYPMFQLVVLCLGLAKLMMFDLIPPSQLLPETSQGRSFLPTSNSWGFLDRPSVGVPQTATSDTPNQLTSHCHNPMMQLISSSEGGGMRRTG